jgi:DNA-binding transcriptional regulator YhcF (GntR family)
VVQIVFLIGSGQLKPGDPLPSVRELAQRLGIHRNTVSQAYGDPFLMGLVEKTRGSRMRVRADGATEAARPDLDVLINAAVRTVREHGYTLQQIRQRVQERLRLDPPDHLLLVEADPGMRVIMRVELLPRVACPIDWCTAEELRAGPERALGALVVSPPGPLAAVAPVLPAERPPIRIVYTAADEHVERVRRLTQPSSIALVSVSPFFLEMGRAVLAPVVGGRHALEEHLLAGDDAELPGEADLFFCDSVTHRLLRPRFPRAEIVHHQAIAAACLDEIEASVADLPATAG